MLLQIDGYRHLFIDAQQQRLAQRRQVNLSFSLSLGSVSLLELVRSTVFTTQDTLRIHTGKPMMQ